MIPASSTAASNYADPKFAGYYECEREEMLDHIPEHVRKVLDVGCGTGAFGRLLKQRRGVEVWGVELDQGVAAQAARSLDRVLVGAFPDQVELPKHYFDCIVFNDVLEHMVDPWDALRQAKRLLTPTGSIAASVPNVRYITVVFRLLFQGKWTYAVNGVLDKTHLRFFTKQSMIELFSETGYEVLRIQGIYPNRRWQVKLLGLVFPGFVNETKYIDYAIVAKPR